MGKKKQQPTPIASLDNRIEQRILDHFGIVSDTHMGSKYEALHELEGIYDYFNERGIKQVYHAGDLTDGVGVYRGQEFEQHAISSYEQIEYVKKNYPKLKDGKTHVIAGNHDTKLMKRGGINPVKSIAGSRRDMKYDGDYYVRYLDDEMGTDMELTHPSGAGYYSMSYGLQKYLRNRKPSQHPDILVQGHRHQAMYGNIQEVHALDAGCFMHASDYIIRKGFSDNIGGWLIEMERDGGVDKFKVEFIKGDK